MRALKRVVLVFLAVLLCFLSGCYSKKTVPTASLGEEYRPLIEKYREYIEYALGYEDEIAVKNRPFEYPQDDPDLYWYNNWVVSFLYGKDYFAKRNSFGYAIKDLNGNGSPELILLLKNGTVLAIFSFVNNKPNGLGVFWDRHNCEINDLGILYTHTSSGAGHWEDRIQEISQDDSKLLLVEQYGIDGRATGDGYYKIIDEEKYLISESELFEATRRMENMFPVGVCEGKTEIMGLEYIPLFD